MVTSRRTPLTREQIAQIEVGHTSVGPGTTGCLLVFFLAAIVAVPMYELRAWRFAPGDDVAATWAPLAGVPAEISARVDAETASGDTTTWKQVVAANRAILEGLHTFEEGLEDDSRLGRLLRPRAQSIMSGWMGVGNERVYSGRDRWLFYRPDVELVTGGGFLEPSRLARRVELADEWTAPPQPDPRKAILAFKRHLDTRGIVLIVMPTPVKPEVHPERLAPRSVDVALPLQNPSYAAFIEAIRRGGVLVFDPAPVLADAARATGTSQYLATDTHWRPEAMEAVAQRLSAFVREHVALPEAGAGYRTDPRDIRGVGDLSVMLDLPENQTMYSPEAATIRRVLAKDGSAWQPSRTSDVLVLGDSFSNIYSLATMGWGDAAGLVEHVSYALQRPVDRIVQNDNGAYATRELLRRGGEHRLSGKRLVIYQFAARELMFGDWRMFE